MVGLDRTWDNTGPNILTKYIYLIYFQMDLMKMIMEKEMNYVSSWDITLTTCVPRITIKENAYYEQTTRDVIVGKYYPFPTIIRNSSKCHNTHIRM